VYRRVPSTAAVQRRFINNKVQALPNLILIWHGREQGGKIIRKRFSATPCAAHNRAAIVQWCYLSR